MAAGLVTVTPKSHQEASMTRLLGSNYTTKGTRMTSSNSQVVQLGVLWSINQPTWHKKHGSLAMSSDHMLLFNKQCVTPYMLARRDAIIHI
jgi:hypothetical protein